MPAVPFPEITPSARRYTPGRLPATRFTSQNGATVLIEYGGIRVNSKLEMKFQNLTDYKANEILKHYQSLKEDDWVEFTRLRGLRGMDADLRLNYERGDAEQALRYRYDGPPQFESVYPGVTTVSCSFIGYLYGAG